MHEIYADPLPSNWEEQPLGTLVETKRGLTWSKEQERNRSNCDTIPVVRIPNIQESLDMSDTLHLEGVTPEQRVDSAVTRGWSLLVGSNGNPKRIGDSVLIEQDREMVFASFLFGLRPKRDTATVTDEYLACWLKLHRVHEFISETSQMTTGLANISWSACRKLPVRFPLCKNAQARIAAVLTAANDHIRALASQIRDAERLRTALIEQGTTLGLEQCQSTQTITRYRHDFVVNDSWDVIELRDLKPQIDYGTNQASNDHAAGVPVIAIPQVLSFRFSLENLPHAELSEQETNSLALQTNDVLLVRTNGNPSYIGKSTVIPDGVLSQTTVFASYLIRIRVNSRLRGPFLNYVLRSAVGRRQSNCLANTSAGNFNLGARALSKFLIPLPPTDVQDEIVQAIDAADDAVLRLENQVVAARRLKQSLLQNLLTGKVRLKP